MVELRAESTICDREDRYIQLGWELPNSSAEYVLISIPATDEQRPDDFFGHNHYVEIRDQLYGQYGGLEHLAVLDEHRVALRINYKISGLDAELTINCAVPIPSEALIQ